MLAAAVVAAHVVLLLGPPLISQDVFGYIAFARMGALHGLDPYTHFPAEASSGRIFAFIGWPFQHSPYGPLFTLATATPSLPLGLARRDVDVQGAVGGVQPRRDLAGRARRRDVSAARGAWRSRSWG